MTYYALKYNFSFVFVSFFSIVVLVCSQIFIFLLGYGSGCITVWEYLVYMLSSAKYIKKIDTTVMPIWARKLPDIHMFINW